jgi:hypothetical protein
MELLAGTDLALEIAIAAGFRIRAIARGASASTLMSPHDTAGPRVEMRPTWWRAVNPDSKLVGR